MPDINRCFISELLISVGFGFSLIFNPVKRFGIVSGYCVCVQLLALCRLQHHRPIFYEINFMPKI